MSVIGLLVALVLFLLVIWAVQSLLRAFSIPDPIRTIVFVIVVILAVLFLVQQLDVSTRLNFRL